ncbi:heterokaryon incompatibility protein-domain-containing protein [Boeremia exigua]|uniref:heterokaryon incompatibility protein-domain-containing protein n=1 Tax=Boeremia exigua TaxID=749465 RepID=UPI001E8DD8B3|nr:heterokaryon incompatibility protein-domain-containing protein [Boeremia exigua]KAH6618813.1 heterokaryon incompatibility protein-domain-containing protein [Boeremia exigua]
MSQGHGDGQSLRNQAVVLWHSEGARDPANELCRTCVSLEVSVDKFRVKSQPHSNSQHSPASFSLVSSTDSKSLGTLTEIYERASEGCSLCVLIVKSAHARHEYFDPRGEDFAAVQHATCRVSWEVDGRKAVRDRARKGDRKQSDTARGLTRRMHLRWDHGSIKDAYVVLIVQDKFLTTASDAHRIWGPESLFLGRRIETTGNIQTRLISWYDLCRQHHSGQCIGGSTQTSAKFDELLSHSYFGVVDVLNMQLTELPRMSPSGDTRYAALSYVWGTKRTFTTTLENINLLRMHGGIEKVQQELPPVIRDAIDLVRRLGLRYIWIDALCITQDSPQSWKLNAYNMDAIYGNADLTICAADGDDAFTGLKAMRPSIGTQHQAVTDCGGGVQLMLSRPPEISIKSSKWNTRAWTFQERLLSRRCLIFVEGRVYFQCPSTGVSEDIYADREGAGWSLDFVDAPLQMFKRLSQRSFWVYMSVVELYSARDLTHPKDVLAAFSGITNRLENQMSAPFVLGLPSSHFDLALLWQFTGLAQRRTPRDEREKEGYAGLKFPSWSWMGWMGAPTTYERSFMGDCLENPSDWLRSHTWIRWFVRDGKGDLRPLHSDFHWSQDRSEESKWRGYSHARLSGEKIWTHYNERDLEEVIYVERYPRVANDRVYADNSRHDHRLDRSRRARYATTIDESDTSSQSTVYSMSEHRRQPAIHESRRRYEHFRYVEPVAESSDPTSEGNEVRERTRRRSYKRPPRRSSEHHQKAVGRISLSFDRIFGSSQETQPVETEANPRFSIYSKECPYRPVVAEYTRNLDSPEFPLMPILQFWTYYTWLNISMPATPEADINPETVRCHIADDSGDWCGSIVLDRPWVESKTFASREFIAISEAKQFNMEECPVWTYYIPKERDQSEWDLFYVLLIERKDEQWERVGLGKVFKEAFMRTAKWREIMLG